MKNFRIGLSKIRISKFQTNLILIFVLFLTGSVLLSPTPILGIYYLVKILEFLFLGFVIWGKGKPFFDFVARLLPLPIIFESILAALQFINRGSLNGIFYFLGERTFNSQTPQIANASINGALILRPYGTFSHPNVLGAFLVLSMSILLITIIYGKKPVSLLHILSFIFGMGALILTFSRSSIIVFVLSLVLVIMRNYLNRKSIKYYLVSIVIIIGAVIFTTLRFRFIPNLSDTSIIDRKDLIVSSFKIITTHPLFGVGLNNFLVELPKYFKGSENVFYIQPVHNVILLLATQIGITPAVILLYFCLLIFLRTNFWGKLIIFEVFFLSLFDHYFLTIQQGQILLTLSLAVVIILSRNVRID